MRLVTVRTDGGHSAARVDGESLTLLPYEDVGEALRSDDWPKALASVDGPQVPAEGADLAAPILRPEKILCVGLNYRAHADEAQMEPSPYPMLFAKFWRRLGGP